MNALCLVVDRLQAAYLGAYGNTWLGTPAVDRLAAEGVVFDQVVADSPSLPALADSYWQGHHAMLGPSVPRSPSLPELLNAADRASILLSDERRVLDHGLAAQFDERVAIEPCWQPRLAESLDQTHLARCFAELISLLEDMPPKFLVWAHLAGLGTSWDAPLEMRDAYRADDDPPPRQSAEVPDLLLPEDFDPDQLLPIMHAYAGQVALFDACLGGLLEFLAESRLREDTLMVLTSPRGFPLGEHRQIGSGEGAIRGELIHVPLVMRFPESAERKWGEPAIGRSQALVQPPDLWATLAEACGDAPPDARPWAASLMPLARGDAVAWRDRLGATGPDSRSERHEQRGLRTPAWYLRLTDRPELYAKPDDRWEANDVASRCPEVVEEMLSVLTQYSQTMQDGSSAEPTPLSHLLVDGYQ